MVLKALEEGIGGEVFVRKMPAHTIGELAEVLLEKVPKERRKIIKIGIRPGEKIHETLISPAESVRTVAMGNYYVILPQISIPKVERKYKGVKRLGEFRYASDTTRRMTKEEIKKVLKREGWL